VIGVEESISDIGIHLKLTDDIHKLVDWCDKNSLYQAISSCMPTVANNDGTTQERLYNKTFRGPQSRASVYAIFLLELLQERGQMSFLSYMNRLKEIRDLLIDTDFAPIGERTLKGPKGGEE
jgi:hypothetical protein